MFLNDSEWQDVKDADDLFRRLQVKARSGADRAFLIGKGTARRLVPIKARRRRLGFYVTYDLFEVEIDLTAADLDDTYQRAAIYALMNDQDARLLNGKSQVLHELNAGRSENASQVSELDLGRLDLARDYLRFFCSFVSSDEGPFTLVESAEDLMWPQAQANSVLKGFDAVIETRREELNWPALPLELTREDLQRFGETGEDALRLFRERTADRDAAKRQADLESARRLPRVVEMHADLTEPGRFNASAVVLYGEALFKAMFRVNRDGTVDMIDDNPLQSAPVPAWTFHPRAPLLLQKKLRRSITGETFTQTICERNRLENGSGKEKPGGSLKNVRVEGDVHLGSQEFLEPVVLDDVEIDGHLILENAELRGGLALLRVKIRGHLRAGGLLCSREFRAEGLRVEGLHDRNPLRITASGDFEVSPTVDLHRAQIRSHLVMPRARIFGGLDLRDAEVHGRVDLFGLQVLASIPFGGAWGCTISGAKFHRGLSLGPALGVLGPGQSARSQITGNFIGDGMELTGQLNLWDLTVEGDRPAHTLSAEEVTPEWLENLDKKTGFFYDDAEKAVVRMKHGPIDPKSFSVRSGRLSLAGAQITGDVLGVGVRIEGHFDLESARINRDFILSGTGTRRASIGGTLSFSRSRIGAVEARGLLLGGDLLAERCRLGSLIVDNGAYRTADSREEVVRREESPNEAVLQRADPKGNVLLLHRTWIGGDVVLTRAAVTGPVQFVGAYFCGRMNATEGEFDGYFSLSTDGTWGVRTILGANLRKENGTIIDFSRASVGLVILGGARVRGTVDFNGSTIRGFLDGNSQSLFRTEIEGSLILSGASVGSDLRFEAAKIDGTVQAITGSFRRVQLRPGWIRQKTEGTEEAEIVTPVEVGGVLLQTISVDSLDFCGLHVRGSSPHEFASGCVKLNNVEVKYDLELSKESLDYLDFELGEKDPRRNAERRPSHFPAEIDDKICLDSVSIGGDLILSHTHCGDRIELKQVHVHGDLFWSAEADTPLETRKRFACIFQRTTIDGEAAVQLRQLERLDLLRCTFRGHLLLNEHGGGGAAAVKIEGSQLTLLKVRTEAERIAAQMVLRRSRIDDLDFQHRLPTRITLENVRIERWLFDADADDNVEGGRLKRLREVLANSSPFDRSNYARISRSLREGGDVKSADRVYVDMRWRAVKESARIQQFDAFQHPRRLGWFKSVWQQPLETFVGLMTGFWTAGYRLLLWACLPTLILTFFVVQVPENFSPSTSQVGENGLRRPKSPNPDDWNAEEKWKIILTYHVPIVSIVAAPQWELAENRSLLLPLPTSNSRVQPSNPDKAVIATAESATAKNTPAGMAQPTPRGLALPVFSPAGYGLVVSLLHWIAWPLALGGLAATIQRRRSTE